MNAEQAIAFLSRLPPNTPLLVWNPYQKEYTHTFLESMELTEGAGSIVKFKLGLKDNNFVTMRAERAF